MTLDELTMDIYNKMKVAFATGNVLIYAGELAGKILGLTPVGIREETVAREAAVVQAGSELLARRTAHITEAVSRSTVRSEPILAPNARGNADRTGRSDSVRTSEL